MRWALAGKVFLHIYFCNGEVSNCNNERAAVTARDKGGLVGYIPQCDENGDYKRKQCSGSTGYCWCVFSNGQKIKNSDAAPGTTKQDQLKCCLMERAEVRADFPIGGFAPTCLENGDYSPGQHWGSTGQSWCAKPDGSKIPGTTTGPGETASDCSKQGKIPTALNSVYTACECSKNEECDDTGKCVCVKGYVEKYGVGCVKICLPHAGPKSRKRRFDLPPAGLPPSEVYPWRVSRQWPQLSHRIIPHTAPSLFRSRSLRQATGEIPSLYECPENEQCDSSGQCGCKEGFVPKYNVGCVKESEFVCDCEENAECDQNGKCVCSKGYVAEYGVGCVQEPIATEVKIVKPKECPECWHWNNEQQNCQANKDVNKCFNLECNWGSMDLDFSPKLFALKSSQTDAFKGQASAPELREKDGRWTRKCPLGTCGMTVTTRYVDDFDDVHLVFGYTLTVARPTRTIGGLKIQMDSPLTATVLFECAYRSEVKVTSTDFAVESVEAGGEAIEFGHLEHGFNITLFSDPSFLTPVGPETLFIGQTVYSRIQWRVTTLTDLVNFYVDRCEIKLPKDRSVDLIKNNCYAELFDARQLQADKIVPEKSDFSFTSFIVDKGARSMKFQLACNIKVCAVNEKKCDDWISTTNDVCIDSQEDTGWRYMANTFSQD